MEPTLKEQKDCHRDLVKRTVSRILSDLETLAKNRKEMKEVCNKMDALPRPFTLKDYREWLIRKDERDSLERRNRSLRINLEYYRKQHDCIDSKVKNCSEAILARLQRKAD